MKKVVTLRRNEYYVSKFLTLTAGSFYDLESIEDYDLRYETR